MSSHILYPAKAGVIVDDWFLDLPTLDTDISAAVPTVSIEAITVQVQEVDVMLEDPPSESEITSITTLISAFTDVIASGGGVP